MAVRTCMQMPINTQTGQPLSDVGYIYIYVKMNKEDVLRGRNLRENRENCSCILLLYYCYHTRLYFHIISPNNMYRTAIFQHILSSLSFSEKLFKTNYHFRTCMKLNRVAYDQILGHHYPKLLYIYMFFCFFVFDTI